VVPASAPRSSAQRRMRLPSFDLERTVYVYSVAGRRRAPEAMTLLNLLRATDWTTNLSRAS